MARMLYHPTVSSSVITVYYIHAVPAPVSITLLSDPVSPVRPVGSTVTLTCTVEFSPAVDAPVTVWTVWTGPAELLTTNIAQPIMGNTSTYTSTTVVSSFGRNQSGSYICTINISSLSPYITDNNGSYYEVVKISVGKCNFVN